MHQKIYFSANKYFPINGTLVYTMVGATAMYLFVLIQFHQFQNEDSV